MAQEPLGFYRFPHRSRVRIRVPEGVTAWPYEQRERDVPVFHPNEGAWIALAESEKIQVLWDGTPHEIRVEWIVDRRRQPIEVREEN